LWFQGINNGYNDAALSLNLGDQSRPGYGIVRLNFDGQTDNGLLELRRSSYSSVFLQEYKEDPSAVRNPQKVPRSVPNILYLRITNTKGYIDMNPSPTIRDKYWRARLYGTLRWIVLINCSGGDLFFWGSGGSKTDSIANHEVLKVGNQKTLYFVGTWRSLTYSSTVDYKVKKLPDDSLVPEIPYTSAQNEPLFSYNTSLADRPTFRMTADNSITPATSAFYEPYTGPGFPRDFPYRSIELKWDFYGSTAGFTPFNQGSASSPRPTPNFGARSAFVEVLRIVGAADAPFNYKWNKGGNREGFIINDDWTLRQEKYQSRDANDTSVYYAAFMNLTGMPLTFTVGSETRNLARDAFGFYVGPKADIVFAPV